MNDIPLHEKIISDLPLSKQFVTEETVPIKLLFDDKSEFIQISGKDEDLKFIERPIFTFFNTAFANLNAFRENTSHKKFPSTLNDEQVNQVQAMIDTLRLYDFYSYVIEHNVKITPDFLRYALAPLWNQERSRSIPGHNYPINKLRMYSSESVSFYENYLQDYKEKEYPAIFTVSSMMEICLCTLDRLAEQESIIKICKCCGAPFVPLHRIDEKYCRFNQEEYGGRNCKEYAKLYMQKQREAEYEATALYKRIYNRLRARRTRAYDKGDLTEYEANDNILLCFMEETSALKEEIAKGKKSNKDLVEWLRKQDKQTQKRSN